MVALLLGLETRWEAFKEAMPKAQGYGRFAIALYIQQHVDRNNLSPRVNTEELH